MITVICIVLICLMVYGFIKPQPDKLIRSNPPAREITLANRKKKMKTDIQIEKDIFLKSINGCIEDGVLQYYMTLPSYGGHQKRYKHIDVARYLAARSLRKDGFTVKLSKRIPYIKNTIGFPYSTPCDPYSVWSKGINISW